MKKLVAFLAPIAMLAVCSTSNADITNAWWHPDGDGAIICTNYAFGGSGPSTSLNMWGTQYGSPAHMLGWVDTSSPGDPTLTLGNSIINESGIAWLGYQVNVYMSNAFTFVTGTPSAANPPNNDWINVGLVAPYALGDGRWEGTLYFAGPSAVQIGQELDYSYAINWSGSLTHFSFTEESFAYMTYVPEPSTFVLAGVGGLMLALRRRRNLLTPVR